MANFLVSKDGAPVLEFSDGPGKITSSALFPEVPDHPFLSGHEIDPGHGQVLHASLAGCSSADGFAHALRAAGYVVEPVVEESSEGAEPQGE